MRYDSSLRYYQLKRLEEIGGADIVVGIPCYNNEKTIQHVIQMVSHGLYHHYREMKAVIYISDGGSTDDTREISKEFQIKPWQEKIVTIYRGPAGKGTAFRSIFEAVRLLRAKVCAVVDSDLRSITSDWVHFLLDPVLESGFEYVSPIYNRHKYDGTITNNIVYNMTRALYGKRIRQPIGGEFALDGRLAKFLLEQDVWQTEVSQYGIDVWMSTMAIINGYKVCQARLGRKVHDAKDPAASLGPMFRQVVGTLFSLMEQFVHYWKPIRGSEPVPTLGPELSLEPEPIEVSLDLMLAEFYMGFQQFGVLWKQLFSEDCYLELERLDRERSREFLLPVEVWVKILYELASTWHKWRANRKALMRIMVPLYFARAASFVNASRHMNTQEAEALVEEQAVSFEQNKDYLLKVWDGASKSNPFELQ